MTIFLNSSASQTAPSSVLACVPPGLLENLTRSRGAASGPAAACAADARARSAETCPGRQEGEQGAEEGDSQPQPGRGGVPRQGDIVCVKMGPSVFWKGSVCAVKCVWCVSLSVSTCEPPAQSGGRCPPQGPRLQGPCSRPEAHVSTDLPPPPRLGRACGSGPHRAAPHCGCATLLLSFPPGTDVSRCRSVCVYWGSSRVSLLVCVLWWTHFFPKGVSQHHGIAVCPALERPAGQASSLVYQEVLPAPSRQDPGRIVPGAALSALLTVATVPGLVTLMSSDAAPFRVPVCPPRPCLWRAAQVFSCPLRGPQVGGGPSHVDAGSVRCVF